MEILEEEGDLINLTPLLDVLFVVLILFILIAPMLDKESIRLAPKGETSQNFTAGSAPYRLKVLADESLLLNDQPILLSELPNQITPLLSSEPPLLILDERASFGLYQRVKNCFESAGFTELDLLVESP